MMMMTVRFVSRLLLAVFVLLFCHSEWTLVASRQERSLYVRCFTSEQWIFDEQFSVTREYSNICQYQMWGILFVKIVHWQCSCCSERGLRSATEMVYHVLAFVVEDITAVDCWTAGGLGPLKHRDYWFGVCVVLCRLVKTGLNWIIFNGLFSEVRVELNYLWCLV